MKVMVIGGGGREHAIIKKIKKNSTIEKIYALPGNGGIAQDAECVNVKATDIVKGNGVIIGCTDQDGFDYGDSGVWTIPSIASGKNVTLTVIVHVTAEGMIANNVTAKSDENDTPVTNETPEVKVLPEPVGPEIR